MCRGKLECCLVHVLKCSCMMMVKLSCIQIKASSNANKSLEEFSQLSCPGQTRTRVA